MWAWEVVVGVGVVGEEAAASVESVGLVWSSWRGVRLTEVGGVDGAGELQNVGGRQRVESREAGMEGAGLGDRGLDADVGQALVQIFGGLGTGVDVVSGCNATPRGVKETGSLVGDRGVAWIDDGVADAVAKLITFRINGVEIDGNMLGEQIENGTGGYRVDEVRNRGDGGAEGYLLEHRVTISGGKGREGNRIGARTGVDLRDLERLGGAKGGVDDSRGVFDHDGRWRKRKVGSKSKQETGGVPE